MFINQLEVKICPKAKKIPISDLYILRVTQKDDGTPLPPHVSHPRPPKKQNKTFPCLLASVLKNYIQTLLKNIFLST